MEAVNKLRSANGRVGRQVAATLEQRHEARLAQQRVDFVAHGEAGHVAQQTHVGQLGRSAMVNFVNDLCQRCWRERLLAGRAHAASVAATAAAAAAAEWVDSGPGAEEQRAECVGRLLLQRRHAVLIGGGVNFKVELGLSQYNVIVALGKRLDSGGSAAVYEEVCIVPRVEERVNSFGNLLRFFLDVDSALIRLLHASADD
jgi:hypothetical protein